MSLYLGNDLISGNKPINLGVRNIGEVFPALLPVTDAGAHLLDGSLILGGGIYQGFVDYIANIVSIYPDVFTTESAWQTSVTTYGVCGKFVYNATNNTVRLPKVSGIIEGATDLTALGNLIEAGLPNITGTIKFGYGSSGSDPYDASGAFYGENQGTRFGRSPDSNTAWKDIKMDASRSSSLYKNNFNKVQPQAIKVLYYIVIANSTKTEIQSDIDEIATDLNGKADTDLTNITNAGYIKMAGAGMPSSRYIDLTLGASGATYTAPADGYFLLTMTGNQGEFGELFSDSVQSSSVIGSTGNWVRVSIPCRKNQIISSYYSATGDVMTFRFIYAVGSESEAS